MYFVNMFRNDIDFAVKMKHKLNLTEIEIKYLLGEEHLHKMEEILAPTMISDIPPVEKEVATSGEKEKTEKENRQQSLLDF